MILHKRISAVCLSSAQVAAGSSGAEEAAAFSREERVGRGQGQPKPSGSQALLHFGQGVTETVGLLLHPGLVGGCSKVEVTLHFRDHLANRILP